jgi:hypothetical protein
MNVLGDGDELSRNGLETRTIAAADLLVIERLLKVHGESLRAAVAATMPCLRCRRCLRLGFRSHLSVGGKEERCRRVSGMVPFATYKYVCFVFFVTAV